MKKVSLLFVFLGLIIFPLVSANGLLITENNFNINKTEGQDYIFNFTIKNTEPYEFKNIESANPIIEFGKFDLASGENKTVVAFIKSDDNFNSQIRIEGDYLISVGYSNKTEIININQNGLDKCNLNLVIGDKIVWVNKIDDQIKLKNGQTNQEITTILNLKNYTKNLSVVESFDYYATLIGLQFTEICNINVMNDEGYVHNSDYDGILNMNLKINYNPTQIISTLYTTSYNMTYNENKEDVMTIKNTGSNIGRSTHLYGDWLTFSENNFDLAPGESKNIQYTINPLIYESSQTNKTYNLNLQIEGNFNTINETLTVYIQTANIGSGLTNGSIDYEFLENAFRLYCQIKPDFEFCDQGLYGTNGSQRIVSTIFNEDTLKEILEATAEYQRQDRSYKSLQQEVDVNQTNALYNLSETQGKIGNELEGLKESNNNIGSVILFQSIFILTLFFLAIGLYVLLDEKKRTKISKKLGLHKGEKTW